MWLSATFMDDRQHNKLTKFFYKNSQWKIDHDKALEKSEEYTKQILEAKKNYILKMTKKLEVLILLQKRTGVY